MKVQLYIDTAKTKLSVKNRLFYIQNQEKQQHISPMRIDSIAITSAVQINVPAIKLAVEHEIPIFIYNSEGKPIAQLRSPDFLKHSNLRYKQLLFMNTLFGREWARESIKLKTDSQCITLYRWAEDIAGIAGLLQEKIDDIRLLEQKIKSVDLIRDGWGETLMGLEGNIARIYFECINLIIPQQYYFEKRSRRPGKDYFNVALNYIYGLTYSRVTRALQAAGLDTFMGVLHKTTYKETLVYDFIELFRPVMDRLLIQMCCENLWQSVHFTPIEGGYLLNRTGKKLIFSHYSEFLHQRINWRDKVTTIENHIFHEARRLRNSIEKTEMHVSDIL